MKRKAVFIINLKSGTSDKAAIPDIIASTLDRDKFDYEIAITQYAGHASEIAEKAKNNGVVACLQCGVVINLNSRDMRIGKALCHHNSHESSAGANVKYTLSSMCPCSKQYPIGAHFHGAPILMYCEFLECERIVRHCLYYFQLSHPFFIYSGLYNIIRCRFVCKIFHLVCLETQLFLYGLAPSLKLACAVVYLFSNVVYFVKQFGCGIL